MNAGKAIREIHLDALKDDDAPILHAWRRDPQLRNGALGYPFPTTLDAERDWIRGFAPKGTPRDLCLAIRDSASGVLLGYCQLRGIDWIARVAEFGVVIGSLEARGHGIGTRALALTIEFATAQLGLRRLWLRVVEFNQVAIRMYENAGFRLEGRLRRHAFSEGSLQDVLIFGKEWPQEVTATLTDEAND